MRIVKNTCPRDCYDTCSIITYVENDKIIKIEGNKEHPITQGILCPKGYLLKDYVYREDRLKHPLKRVGAKGEGKFEEISLDSALEIVASKIREIINKYGSEAIVHYEYAGNSGLLSYNFPKRLFYALNASYMEDTICDLAGEKAIELHYGKRYGLEPETLPQTKLIIFWGYNPANSSIHTYMFAKKAVKDGSTVVTIDPIRTLTSKLGWHIRPKPGTDGFLAMGIANLLIANDWIDKDLIANYTYGFEVFREYAKRYSLERVSKVTGVSSNDIEKLAAMYANEKPSGIYIGIGIQKQKFGAETVRTISLLPALIGIHRGFYFCNNVRDFDYSYLSGKYLATKKLRSFPMQKLGEVLNRKDIKMLYVYNANPLATVPNNLLVKKGLEREDLFVVVHDLFLTDTVDYADIVFPAASPFEITDIYVSYWHHYLSVNQPAIPPIGDALSNAELTRRLARKLNLTHEHLYEDDMTVIHNILEKSNLFTGSVDELFQKGFLKLKTYPRDVYQTPSSKIEFYSSTAIKMGINPLPRIELPEEDEKYPFRLISSSHRLLLHSQYYQTHDIEPFVMINPKDAEAYAISDGDYVTLHNKTGSCEIKAKITDDVPTGVLWTFRTPWPKLQKDGRNINAITSDDTQNIADGVTTNSTYVNIKV